MNLTQPVLPSAGSVRDFGEALEPLVRSAKIVHSWGNDVASGLVLTELLSADREGLGAQPVIDVEPSPLLAADVSSPSQPVDTQQSEAKP
jgi:hypothetical protein